MLDKSKTPVRPPDPICRTNLKSSLLRFPRIGPLVYFCDLPQATLSHSRAERSICLLFYVEYQSAHGVHVLGP